VVVPFAGVPLVTLQLLKQHPQVQLYNLHHNAADTAELAIALMLSAARLVVPLDQRLRKGDWSPRYEPSQSLLLEGRNVVVIGFGEIGQRIGRSCRGLGMHVTGVSRSGKPPADASIGSLHELLPKAEVLFIAAPQTPETEGLIGAVEMALLPNDAILVNIARGEIVDEHALFDALKEGKLHSAGLDVWYQYPTADQKGKAVPSYFNKPESATHTFPSRLPFHELPNVVLSPHRGGVSKDTESRRIRDLARLLVALAEGNEAPNRVDLERGY
jgi:phosphoglycerate dehydrogenase-like enzyme